MVGAGLISSKDLLQLVDTRVIARFFFSVGAFYSGLTRIKYAGREGVTVAIGHDLCMWRDHKK